ncbi:MAG: AI-2E family transporter [Bdellovibrio sp.]|jgi:predicted PurR-regulated permease PerM
MSQVRQHIVAFVFIALYLILFLPFWKAIVAGCLVGLSFRHLQNIALSRVTNKPKRYHVYGPYVLLGGLFLILLAAIGKTAQFLKETPPTVELAGALTRKINDFRDQIFGLISKFLGESENLEQRLTTIWDDGTHSAVNALMSASQNFLTELPMVLLNTAVFFSVVVIFMVGMHRRLTQELHLSQLQVRSPLSWTEIEVISFNGLGSILLIGLIQAALVVVGSQIAGVSYTVWIFLGTFLMSFLPVAGAGSVPFILAVSYGLDGNMEKAGVLAVTFLVVATIDNVLRAWLFSRLSNVNPFVSLLAVIGSIILFGLPGLLMAPVLEQIAIRVWKELNSKPAASLESPPPTC